MKTKSPIKPVKRFKIPRSIWALGFVSLLMDTSSEMIHSLLPILMVTTLGASMTAVGIIEGLAEAVSLIFKVFSGTLSDYFRRRKTLTFIGYALATLTKPFFPLAQSLVLIFTARFVDRIGKGIRDAPRDALIGDIAPPEIRGACFGLRQSMDTIGGFLGPILAIAGMYLFLGDIRTVMWFAVIPAVLSLLILFFYVQEPQKSVVQGERIRIRISDLGQFRTAYWKLVAVAGMLTLARFSEAFLILKAHDTGVSLALVPLVMVLMNVIYALFAYPAGMLSDTMPRKYVLLIGIGFLIIADCILGMTTHLGMLALGVVFWGMHMAFTHSLLAAMVTDTAPEQLRGTAYGVFNLVCGIAMLFSSITAGLMWDQFGPSWTFFTGALFTTIAFVSLLLVNENHGRDF